MAQLTAYIGLGSNLAHPPQQIRSALKELDILPDSRLLVCSPFYRSKPLGPPGQPDYINAVAALATALPALELLTGLLAIEDRHGRIRTEVRWGPRTLDLDLLLYGDRQTRDKVLTLPHPHLSERSFVLYPLYDIAPDLVIPGRGPLRELLQHCPRQELTQLEIQ
ncbi:MAG TPA: 2-amino-4-hydroxy-6-hydroxymethyldihydropteridine diphosphokinase [Gammaproteobacteria bacterium]|nr:2-amino-4-hydroxy-6-hydroxymethyldihydropteridine diphosphokinase [Gammaproteobacteria bacterium]